MTRVIFILYNNICYVCDVNLCSIFHCTGSNIRRDFVENFACVRQTNSNQDTQCVEANLYTFGTIILLSQYDTGD